MKVNTDNGPDWGRNDSSTHLIPPYPSPQDHFNDEKALPDSQQDKAENIRNSLDTVGSSEQMTETDSICSSSDSDDSTIIETPNVAQQIAFLSSSLSPSTRAMIDRVVDQTKYQRSQRAGFNESSPGGQIQGSRGAFPKSTSTSEKSQLPSKKNGKGIRSRNANPDESSDDESEKNGEILNLQPQPPSLTKQRLACPFHQRNPSNHTKYPSCSGRGWEDVHRVKLVLLHSHMCVTDICKGSTSIEGMQYQCNAHAAGPSLKMTGNSTVICDRPLFVK
jgi:hypothetical protein